MGIKDRIKAAANALTRPAVSLDDTEFLKWMGIDANLPRKELNEVTYFTCLKMLSETMGKLPLKFYQDTDRGKLRADLTDAAARLITRPNNIMTPATFWGTIEFNCQHYGNAFVLIQSSLQRQRYGGSVKIKGFWPMQSECVQVLMDDQGVFGDVGKLYYRYTDPHIGKSETYAQENVLHFKTWFSRGGVLGKSVREMLSDTVNGAGESQKYLNTLYKDGLTASMALQYTGDLDKQRRLALQKEYNSLLTGAKNAGKVVAVPVGMTLQPLNVSLADAQFFELKKYSALQIAAAFGIKPNQLNNYEKSSYANSETQQLAFLVDTMSYRLTQYEQELNYKVLTEKERSEGYFFKFNEKALLRTDAKTQMANVVSAVTNGLYTINEGRELLDLPYVEGGDVNMVNGTYQPITQIGKAYQKKEKLEEPTEEIENPEETGGGEESGNRYSRGYYNQ